MKPITAEDDWETPLSASDTDAEGDLDLDT